MKEDSKCKNKVKYIELTEYSTISPSTFISKNVIINLLIYI